MGIIPERFDAMPTPLRVGMHPGRNKEIQYAAGQLGYAQVVANQGGITALTDLTNLSVTVDFGANRRIKISMDALVNRTVADGVSSLLIREGGTILQDAEVRPSTTEAVFVHRHVVITPSAGLHTYKLSLVRANGTGTTGIVASSTFPTSILVEDIGSST
jgi:hypothetical protein